MKFLLIVNASPWGSTLANTAARFARAALAAEHELGCVFFQGEGVYNALRGASTDPGASDLHLQWRGLAERHGTDLMLCSAAATRRLPAELNSAPPEPFRLAGLGALLDLAGRCNRVVSF